MLPEACLRPPSRSNEDIGEEAWGEMGDWTGVVSGEEEVESEVLSLVVRVRKIGILSVCTCVSFKLLLLDYCWCRCRNSIDGS